jgi:nucleoside-diphosphate kinase
MNERSLILIKPDGVKRGIIGRVLTRFEEKGLKIVAMRMVHMTPQMSDLHYREHIERPFYPGLRDYITSGPVIALVLEAPGVISIVRTMNGVTDGAAAAPGTIRGDFAINRSENIVHASDSPESAAWEIQNFFPGLGSEGHPEQ